MVAIARNGPKVSRGWDFFPKPAMVGASKAIRPVVAARAQEEAIRDVSAATEAGYSAFFSCRGRRQRDRDSRRRLC
jgi:hypothetical protein